MKQEFNIGATDADYFMQTILSDDRNITTRFHYISDFSQANFWMSITYLLGLVHPSSKPPLEKELLQKKLMLTSMLVPFRRMVFVQVVVCNLVQ